MRSLIRGGSVVSATGTDRADILIDGEHIAALGADLDARADRVIDAGGCLVLPGLVDSHTHLAMPTMGTITADDFDSGTAAAVAGGTTSIVDFALQTDGSLMAGLEAWRERARDTARIDYGFHLAITDASPKAVEEMAAAVEAGVTSFKVFMAFKGSFMADDAALLRVLHRTRQTGGLVQVHAENGDAIEVNIAAAREAGDREPRYHAATRPSEVEAEATARAARLAHWARRPVFIVHVSSADAVAEIQHVRDAGWPVHAETCVHYLLLTEDELSRPDFEGAKYVCSPPLRATSDQDVLWRALRQGAIRICTTDHCPFNFCGQKELGREDFAKIPNGLPTIEHRLTLLYDRGVRTGRITENELVAMTAAEPARIFGLPGKGTTAPGADADLVIFDPERELTISAATHRMAVDHSVFEGWKCRGGPVRVLARGRDVYADGDVVAEPGQGRYLRRTTGPFGPGPIDVL